MSVQAAKDFITHANHDDAIRSIARERFLEIESVGSEHGFDFTRDDFAQAMRERRGTGADVRLDQIHNCQCGHHPDDPDQGPGNCQCGDTRPDDPDKPTSCQCGPIPPVPDPNCQCGQTEDPPHPNCQCGQTEDPPKSNCQCGETEDPPKSNCQCGETEDPPPTNCQCGHTPPPHKPGSKKW
jgi:hypothetical protein